MKLKKRTKKTKFFQFRRRKSQYELECAYCVGEYFKRGSFGPFGATYNPDYINSASKKITQYIDYLSANIITKLIKDKFGSINMEDL